MRRLILALAAFSTQAWAVPPQASPPPAAGASAADVQAAMQAAQAAKAAADAAAAQAAAASSTANSASTAASNASSTATAASTKADSASSTASAAQSAVTTLSGQVVKQVNGISPTAGAVSLTIPVQPDLTPYAKSTDVTSAITGALTGYVKTVNGNTPNASGALSLTIPAAPDLSSYATTGALSSLQSSIMAAMPQPSSTTPKSDAVGGVTGTAMSYMRADAQPNRITRAGSCVLSTPAGTCSLTWATPFPASVTSVNLIIEPVNTTGSAVVCNPTTTQAQNVTSPAIRCWFARPLPATLTLLSALVSYDVFGLTPTGMTVTVTGIPTTQ